MDDLVRKRRLYRQSSRRLRRRARRAAEMRRYRANDKAGIKIARAPYDAVVLDFLIAMKMA